MRVTAYGTTRVSAARSHFWDRIKPNVVVLMFCSDNDRKDNTANTRMTGRTAYFDVRVEGGQFAGLPVPWSRHLYFDDNWLRGIHGGARRDLGLLLARSPVVSLPDRRAPDRHDAREGGAARREISGGLQFHDPQLEAYLATAIPYASFDAPSLRAT